VNRPTEQILQLFLRQFTTAVANASLYGLDHPQVLKLCQQATEQLPQLTQDSAEAIFKIVDKRLIFDDQPVATSMAAERFCDALKQHDLSYISLATATTNTELVTLAGGLSKRREQALQPSEHIHFGRIEVRRQFTEQDRHKSSASADFTVIAEQDRDKFMDIYHTMKKTKRLNLGGISEIVNDFISTFDRHSDVLMALAPLRSMDEYVYTHSVNICLLNLAQAKLLGIEGQQLNEIGIAAMLHDVGKMFIPSDILNKPGKLDDREWEIMRSHPQVGAEYLLNTPGVPRLAVVTAYEHHIGYDGSGYPATPHNWNLNTCSYLTSIADVYDALRTKRAYKKPLNFSQIQNIMRESAGKSLHPELTDSFLDALSKVEQTN
jgi:HD-GYP domain-containing protein (c-di-GMP phosphodiesterase class II)